MSRHFVVLGDGDHDSWMPGELAVIDRQRAGVLESSDATLPAIDDDLILVPNDRKLSRPAQPDGQVNRRIPTT